MGFSRLTGKKIIDHSHGSTEVDLRALQHYRRCTYNIFSDSAIYTVKRWYNVIAGSDTYLLITDIDLRLVLVGVIVDPMQLIRGNRYKYSLISS